MRRATVVNLRREPYDVYIGRAGRGEDGYLGNPYAVGRRCRRCGRTHETPGDTLPCFREYFLDRVTLDAKFRARVHACAGRRLGCFCKPGPCHGDVIAEYLDALRATRARERRDDAALRTIVALRSARRAWRMPRGDRYVVGDEEYEVWRVTRRSVVLKSVRRPNSFLELTPTSLGRWRSATDAVDADA